MQFGLAFKYFLNRTGGFANLLLVTVCNLIPVVGPIVALGYRAEVAQALLRDDELRRHPKFDFNRFVEYLSRGVWPFLISLVLGLFLVLLILASFVIALAIGAAMNQPEAGMIAGIICYALSILVFVLIATPMTFHAELTNRFDLGGAFRFAMAFWKTVGGLAIVTILVYIPLSLLVTLLGLLACFVGIYPASALTQMAGLHLLVQLYVEYLERGGDPIYQYDPRDEYDDEEDDDDRDDDDVDDDRPRRRGRSS